MAEKWTIDDSIHLGCFDGTLAIGCATAIVIVGAFALVVFTVIHFW